MRGLLLTVLLSASVPLARLALAPTWAPLPKLGMLPAFTFTSEQGKPFGTAELAGRPYVANFVFTRCPTVCPVMTQRMSELQAHLTGLEGEVHLVSFSVDPAFDTPSRLLAYAQAHHANPRRWTFLTGDSAAMQRTVVHGFHVALSREGPDDDFLSIVHGTHFLLVDGVGEVRGYYDSSAPAAMKQLRVDAGRLVNTRS